MSLLEVLQAEARLMHDVGGDSRLEYAGLADLIAREGTDYRAVPLLKGVRPMQAKHCFENAFTLARAARDTGGLVYVEGYGATAMLGIPMLHAWCITPDGRVVDPTWPDAATAEYRGIAFPFDLVRLIVLRTGSYGILEDWHNDFPLLRQPFSLEAARSAYEPLPLKLTQKYQTRARRR